MTGLGNAGARALLAATAFAMVVAGCGGSSSDPTAAPTTTGPADTTAAPADTTAAPAATTAAPADTTASPETTAPAGDDDLFALGEDLFLISAGGVGCASCHGKEALGDVGVGPNIQGKAVSDIKLQLEENELMEFLKKALSPEDIEAVAVYLAYLKENAG